MTELLQRRGDSIRPASAHLASEASPDLKRTPYVWLTDLVGWLPMPDGRDEEAALTADCTAEMVEQIARFSRLRDRALFVGIRTTSCPIGSARRVSGSGPSSTSTSSAT